MMPNTSGKATEELYKLRIAQLQKGLLDALESEFSGCGGSGSKHLREIPSAGC
jgi:hypothetical protein